MREFKYNVIDLIHNVRNRPCLWDRTIENYKDRVERRLAWEEIFNNLDETYEEMTPEEKRITGEIILHKWTNIRDTFSKSLKTKMGKPKKRYLLYDHLEFLTKIIPEDERHRELINSESSFMKQEEPDSGFSITTEIEPESSTSFAITNVTSFSTKKCPKGSDFEDAKSNDDYMSEVNYGTKRSKRSDFDSNPTDNASEVSYSRKSSRTKKKSDRFVFEDDLKDKDSVSSKKKSRKSSVKGANEDIISVNDQLNDIDFVEVDDNDPRIMNEDEAFFASLLPTIVKYSEDERLEFRIQVLGIMKKLKEKNNWTAE